MTTKPTLKYIRTEAPACVTVPLVVTLDDRAMEALHAYRQLLHLYNTADAVGDLETARQEYARFELAQERVASALDRLVREALAEPNFTDDFELISV